MTTDYAPIIRAEIERDVARLRDRVTNDSFVPREVEIGYLVPLHRGRSVLPESTVAGLTIRSHPDPRAIRVRSQGGCGDASIIW